MSIQGRLMIASPFLQHFASDKVERTQKKDYCKWNTCFLALFSHFYTPHLQPTSNIRCNSKTAGTTQNTWIDKREKRAKHKNLFWYFFLTSLFKANGQITCYNHVLSDTTFALQWTFLVLSIRVQLKTELEGPFSFCAEDVIVQVPKLESK